MNVCQIYSNYILYLEMINFWCITYFAFKMADF